MELIFFDTHEHLQKVANAHRKAKKRIAIARAGINKYNALLAELDDAPLIDPLMLQKINEKRMQYTQLRAAAAALFARAYVEADEAEKLLLNETPKNLPQWH